jgi:hypothetical protein
MTARGRVSFVGFALGIWHLHWKAFEMDTHVSHSGIGFLEFQRRDNR